MIGYIFISGVKNLLRNKLVNTLVVLAFALGLIFPLVVLCIGNSMIQAMNANLPIYPERTGAIDTGTIKINIEAIKKQYSEIEEITVDTFSSSDTVLYNDNVTKCLVYARGSNLEKIVRYNVYEGDYFTTEQADSNQKICIISVELYKELGSNVGDNITLSGEQYKVIGIIDKSGWRKSVTLPIKTYESLYSPRYTYNILLKKGLDFKTTGIDISSKMLKQYNLPTENSIIVLTDFFSNELANIKFALLIMFSIAGVVFVYAALNIYNILANKINKDILGYKIKIQLGAKKRHIYTYLFTQLFILTLIASIIDSLLLIAFRQVVPLIASFTFKIDYMVFLLLFVSELIFITLLCMLLLRKVYTKQKEVQ